MNSDGPNRVFNVWISSYLAKKAFLSNLIRFQLVSTTDRLEVENSGLEIRARDTDGYSIFV